MKTYLRYFLYSSILTILALIVCYMIGGWKAVLIGATLGILEISLSFDNAVVNASVLTSMSEVWRRRFLFWGILIAVFGARLLIPIFIVSATSGLNPVTVFKAAFIDTETYAALINNIHIYVSGFGAAFLGMVFLKFFFNENKTHHWIKGIEKYMQKLGVVESIQALIMLIVTVCFSELIASHVSVAAKAEFLTSSIWGIVIYLLIDGITYFIKPKEEENSESPAITTTTTTNAGAAKLVARTGLVSFLYLEVLDTSFSLDGVIGAFAITQDILIILIGLTIGAFFVRSFTIFIVEKKVLRQLAYLEHGAFWSIGLLAFFMLLNTILHIPEFYIVGSTIFVLAISILHSWLVFRKTKS